ncbi:hypothetical protein C9374_011184 [Naegleria lovaniensis]|uniref:Uncharacterized protein n=1 Tax=Naegleria lovaniensis TaxID=51637 RepID=A0AA88KCR7_NAELO|nr:uncharacterized protein C9374_011184 [Naegleria lovaniensis]KAG2374105.1 hypothetical protein C9374_011184 [Naegleria lovaniensis]
MSKPSGVRQQERRDHDMENFGDEQVQPSSPLMEHQTKKLKNLDSMESTDFMMLQEKISQHNEGNGFVFETEEQKTIFEKLITVESDPFIITNAPLYEKITTGLREQYKMMQHEDGGCSWWSLQSAVTEINEMLSQGEKDADAILSALKGLKPARIPTPYDLFLQSQKSLPPNASVFTTMRMVNHLLTYQFRFKKNVRFGIQLVERSQVLFPDAFAQLDNAIGDSTLVFFKCEGLKAETLKHKDNFRMYVEMKGMLREWMDALVIHEKHTIENAQMIKVYGLLVSKFQCKFLEGSIKIHDDHNISGEKPFRYAIKESNYIDLETIDGVAEFTTFIEIICEHVFKCKLQIANDIHGEKGILSSKPIL